MNKNILIALCLVFFGYQHSLTSLEIDDFSLETRVTAFFPDSKTFRDIYGKVNPSYELQANLDLGQFSGWINTSWFQKHGKSIGLKDSTNVNISSTSIGLSYLFPSINNIQPYIGLGPNFGVIWLHNKSSCSPKKPSKFALGASVKLGLWMDIYDHFYLNAFVDYVYQPVSFKPRQDIGGVKPGLGLGYKF